MRVEFHPHALQEYEIAISYYETRKAGLGERFIHGVEHAIESIRETPCSWPLLVNDVRRRLLRVFPYAILYSDESDFILIIAIMHCHQQPGYWQYRVVQEHEPPKP